MMQALRAHVWRRSPPPRRVQVLEIYFGIAAWPHNHVNIASPTHRDPWELIGRPAFFVGYDAIGVPSKKLDGGSEIHERLIAEIMARRFTAKSVATFRLSGEGGSHPTRSSHPGTVYCVNMSNGANCVRVTNAAVNMAWKECCFLIRALSNRNSGARHVSALLEAVARGRAPNPGEAPAARYTPAASSEPR